MIPLATTTVDVTRESEPEPGEGITTTAVASDVRACVASPTGRDLQAAGGGSQVIDAVLDADHELKTAYAQS